MFSRKPLMLKAPFLVLWAFSFLASGCFTGVEYTPKIKAPAPVASQQEEKPLLGDIKPEMPNQWVKGKKFYVTDSRISLIFGASAPEEEDLKDELIQFQGIEPVEAVDGSEHTMLYFLSPRGALMGYKVAMSPDSIASLASLTIPFTIQESEVDTARERLAGNSFYILTRQWRDSLGELIHGSKFIPVKILSVTPGTTSQPFKIKFVDDNNREGFLFANASSLSLSPINPLDNVERLTRANRQLIIDGKIVPGMTMQEARLSLGSPATVDRRVTYGGIEELWSYETGVYLRFLDGILQQFRL